MWKEASVMGDSPSGLTQTRIMASRASRYCSGGVIPAFSPLVFFFCRHKKFTAKQLPSWWGHHHPLQSLNFYLCPEFKFFTRKIMLWGSPFKIRPPFLLLHVMDALLIYLKKSIYSILVNVSIFFCFLLIFMIYKKNIVCIFVNIIIYTNLSLHH